jgi:hypothetical protein
VLPRPRRPLLPILPLLLLAPAAARPAEDGPPCAPGRTVAVAGLGTPEDDLLRVAELAGAAPLEPGIIRRGGLRLRTLCDGRSAGWTDRLAPAPPDRALAVLPARAGTLWNSTYPSGGNDGLLWAGRGAGLTASAGVAARFGVLTAAVQPEVAWQQNRWFETVPTGRPGSQAFMSPWYGEGIDLPQRFGAGPFGSAALGQSFVRADVHGAAVGVSSENRWLGPGTRNAILLTNDAPGFPHLFAGTSAPVDVGIGTVEALILWARLDRSRYFPTQGHPWLTALAVDYSPRWVPGLTVGAGRLYVESLGSLRDDHYLTVLEGLLKQEVKGGDNPFDNQIASGWFRWAMPDGGVEVYGEWGRDDFPASLEGLIREPDRTQAWVAGFQKVLRAGPRLVRVQLELSRFYEGRPLNSPDGMPVWYTHGNDLGVTYRGQLLGAQVGPGGGSQYLGVDVFTGGGRLGGFVERTSRNQEAFWTIVSQRDPRAAPDAEIAAGLRQVLFAGPVEVSWLASAAFRWDRDFLHNEPNVQLGVQVAVPVGAPPTLPQGGSEGTLP